ncbi:MAG: hypothetical protein GDA36_09755, partial [Rhodobacteraceae bacterium]|nr:hypothetical protein [Paracoccaceae bacterium]
MIQFKFEWPAISYQLGSVLNDAPLQDSNRPKRVLIMFSDDSTLFFARQMRNVLVQASSPVEIKIGLFLPEASLSYRQLVQQLPEGIDYFITSESLVNLASSDGFDAILTSRVYRPLSDLLKRPFFRCYANRPCIIAFLGGLDFSPKRGFAHRKNCDGVYILPLKRMMAFRALSEKWGDAGWQEVGFGHPAFLMPIKTTPQPNHRDIYFFTQAISPRTRKGRLYMLNVMATIARLHPDRNVWIKLRHLPNENRAHLHKERYDYPSLASFLTGIPPNLKFTHCTMEEALRTAGLGITCTSTAAIDTIRSNVPTM